MMRDMKMTTRIMMRDMAMCTLTLANKQNKTIEKNTNKIKITNNNICYSFCQMKMTTIMTNVTFQNKLAFHLYWFAFIMIWLKRKLSCTRSIKSRAARAERSKEQMGRHAMWNKHIETLLMSTLILKKTSTLCLTKKMLHSLSKKIYLYFETWSENI